MSIEAGGGHGESIKCLETYTIRGLQGYKTPFFEHYLLKCQSAGTCDIPSARPEGETLSNSVVELSTFSRMLTAVIAFLPFVGWWMHKVGYNGDSKVEVPAAAQDEALLQNEVMPVRNEVPPVE